MQYRVPCKSGDIKKCNNAHSGSFLAGRTTLIIVVIVDVELGSSDSRPELCVYIFLVYVEYESEHIQQC
jgi:hypothetical protein